MFSEAFRDQEPMHEATIRDINRWSGNLVPTQQDTPSPSWRDNAEAHQGAMMGALRCSAWLGADGGFRLALREAGFCGGLFTRNGAVPILVFWQAPTALDEQVALIISQHRRIARASIRSNS
jgi:hypothetical protein